MEQRANARRLPARLLLCLASTWGLAAPARADGIDVSVWFTRVFTDVSGGKAALVIAGLMLVNYAVNALVVTLPAVRASHVSARDALRDTIGLTVLGQVADRVGAVLALVLSLPVLFVADRLYPPEPSEELPGLASLIVVLGTVGILCSGATVGLLAFHYAHRRWKAPRRTALRIAWSAAFLTNPLVWALAAGFGAESLRGS